MQCMSVDLPEPDGPMMALKRPVSNATVTWSTATTTLSSAPYTLQASIVLAALVRVAASDGLTRMSVVVIALLFVRVGPTVRERTKISRSCRSRCAASPASDRGEGHDAQAPVGLPKDKWPSEGQMAKRNLTFSRRCKSPRSVKPYEGESPRFAGCLWR